MSTIARIIGAAAVAMLLATAGAAGAPAPNGDWLGFGSTPDNVRHSPLTQITPANVSGLARKYTVDFLQIDPSIKKGQQSYPLAVGGRLYVTTNDNGVFAIDGATGRVLWRLKQPNVAVFKNFGIVANRGLAYCDGKLFLLTLDMHVESISPRNGHIIKRVAISSAVPGAAANYGYSETSAPICANGRVIFGAAGSEYGVRGFVMALTTDLRPAWSNPYWTIPPEQQSWRSQSRIVGGGAVWTPVTVDTSTNTLYFGTGSATPLYFPSIRPGTNPRTDSLIAVDLKTGATKWWRQLVAGNEWSYDVAQPPLVYTAKVGGKTHRIVSVATMEGVWFAFDASNGSPFYQRVKVIDRVEHPALQPGKPVVVYPSSLGGLNYSPASFDPSTHYVFNAAAETAAIDVQAKLTPTQKRHKFVLGDVFLGLQNGNFGSALQGWHDHGSVSAIDVATGRRVWKFQTPEPERGGVTTTSSGLGFVGGGDGMLRAFDVRNGKVLWKFQTGAPIASGPTVFLAGGKEYVAITVGGTPTSSNGGTASKLEVFALGAGKPVRADTARGLASARSALTARMVTAAPIALRAWSATSQNAQVVSGRVMLGGRPVAGVALVVDGYPLQQRSDAAGRFRYRIDTTLARRRVVTVASVARARVRGRLLSSAERAAVSRLKGSFAVAYRITGLHAGLQNGHVVVTGRASLAGGGAPPPVVLYTYRLSGTVTDSDGRPVSGAVVVSRTQDRDFWTSSTATDAHGRYTSFFAASDEAGSNPVPITVQVAVGSETFASAFGDNVMFPALRSASLDLRLPASPSVPLPIAKPASRAGAVYEGVMVGVSGPHGVIKPISATWPDRTGHFRLVLPASARGASLRVWEDPHQVFSSEPTRSGASVPLAAWPSSLEAHVPQSLASVRAPR